MTISTLHTTTLPDDAWRDALQAAAAFLAGFRSPDTRKGYRRDLTCWLQFCATQGIHPYPVFVGTHVEVYLRQLEQQIPALANSTLRRRISTLSSWFTWLEDEEINVGNPRRSGSPATPTRTTAAVARSQRADRSARSCRSRGRVRLPAGLSARAERPARLRSLQ